MTTETETAVKDTRTITVIKPFKFIEPSSETNRLPPDHTFMPNKDAQGRYLPTDFEVDAWIAEHEYLSKQFADGAIERPEVKEKRLAAAAEAERARQENIRLAQEEADAALARVQSSAVQRGAESQAAADDLNTPVNELGVRAGAGIDAEALKDELNTPVSVLRERQAAKVRAAKAK